VAKLVVFGAGDIARLARFYFATDSEHDVVAFAVDPEFRTAESFMDLPLVSMGDVVQRYPPSSHKMFIAVSYRNMNRVRAAKYAEAKSLGYELVSYVSSRCTFLAAQAPGDNCFILEDNTIQPFVTIGNDVTLWSGNHVGHDVVINDHSFISSHVVISGHAEIGRNCFIGVNATIRNSVHVADYTLVGAGALIMKNTTERSVYLGTRAERFAKSSDDVEL
jgi:sugar O-acyltransferase (sialic acid O-acetyltransferase NeuD family)